MKNKSKFWFSEKANIIDKPFESIIKKKEKVAIHYIRNKTI